MLALFAGTGALPGLLVAALAQEGDRPVVCYMDGFAPDLPADLERIAFRIEHLGTLLKELRARGLERVCLAGKVLRPEIDPSRIDAATAPLVAGLGAAMKLGDDGTLRALMAIFESFGFRIVAAHEIAPDLLPSAGHLAGPAPTPSQQDDAKSGKAHLDDLAPADIGQACVVREGRVLAMEASLGTDFMLGSLSSPAKAAGAVFCKAPKVGQDRRADLPAIGPETIVGAHAAGIKGVWIEAGGVMCLEIERLKAEADRYGISVWVGGV
jgi:DUF1009 family protein